VYDKLPTDKHHGWKFISFGPDGKLYVPVGAPCNVCEKDEPVYSSITRMNKDGSGFEVYAKGVINWNIPYWVLKKPM
jgi:glucose/arabinose dehydrogenase